MRLHDDETIAHWTRAGHWGDATLLDTFAERVVAHPEREGIVDPPDRADLDGRDPESVSWGQLGRVVDGLATALLDAGLQRDEIVLVQLPNTWELCALYLAIAKAGGIISPLPVQWRRHELAYIADLTGARHVIAAESFKGEDLLALARDGGAGTLERFWSLHDIREAGGREPDDERLATVTVGADDVFTICWTSGTEAEPKGCPHTHNSWRSQCGRMIDICRVEEGSRILALAPIVNMTGVGVLLIPWLMQGGTLLLHHPLNAPVLLDQLQHADVDFAILVPALLNTIAKHPRVDELDLSSVGRLVTGSAPPSQFAMEEFKRRWGIEVLNIWGQNEGTAILASPEDVPDIADRVDHMPWWGRPDLQWPTRVDSAEVKVLADDGTELEQPGDVGELVYRGPSVFPGYFRRPDITQGAFTADGFFRTGDQFRVIDERYLAFYDRKKDIIIRGGNNISAAEVENAAMGVVGVAEAAAVALPDERLGEKVCLFVAPTDADQPPTLDDVTGHLREQGFAVYKLPERLELIEAIPRNPVGKILKTDLRDELHKRLASA